MLGKRGRGLAGGGDSHEAQLGLAANKDLPEALDASHLHLDLVWGHAAVHHGHVPRACGDAGKTEDMWRQFSSVTEHSLIDTCCSVHGEHCTDTPHDRHTLTHSNVLVKCLTVRIKDYIKQLLQNIIHNENVLHDTE